LKTLETKQSKDLLSSIQKIVVAVDLSKHSEATTHYAAELAKCFNANLYVVHVFSPASFYAVASENTYLLIDEECARLRRKLDQLTDGVREEVPKSEAILLMGDPAEEIKAMARDINADLIITASHYPGFLARLFNLDKAPKIMHHAPCPVLVYHEQNR
jgi:nucleotide-binding universal stress UspA family protein